MAQGAGSSGDAEAESQRGLATVAVTEREFEARALAAVLEDAGIRAFVFPFAVLPGVRRLSAGRQPVGVPVQVAPADLERARIVLTEARELGRHLDWETVDVGSPEGEADARFGGVAHATRAVLTSRGCAVPILILLVVLPILVALIALFV